MRDTPASGENRGRVTSVKVFRGIGAVVVGVKSHTSLTVAAILTSSTTVDVTKLPRFSANLKMTASQSKPWRACEYDDRGLQADGTPAVFDYNGSRTSLGITTIGTPVGIDNILQFAIVGALYIESNRYNKLRDDGDWPPWPPPNTSLYLPQFSSIAYEDIDENGDKHGMRYHGFRGEVTAVLGTRLKVLFNMNPASRKDGVEIEFDYTDPTECDSHPPDDALVGIPSDVDIETNLEALTVGTQCMVFLSLRFAAEILDGPKIPLGLELAEDHGGRL